MKKTAPSSPVVQAPPAVAPQANVNPLPRALNTSEIGGSGKLVIFSTQKPDDARNNPNKSEFELSPNIVLFRAGSRMLQNPDSADLITKTVLSFVRGDAVTGQDVI